MHKNYTYQIVFRLILVFFLISCDKNNVVGPQFSNDNELVEISDCGGETPSTKTTEWPGYDLKSTLSLSDDDFYAGSGVMAVYTLTNDGSINQDITFYGYNPDPLSQRYIRVKYSFTGPNWSTEGDPDTTSTWNLQIAPNESLSDSIFFSLGRLDQTFEGFGFDTLTAELDEIVNPDLTFPVQLTYNSSGIINPPATGPDGIQIKPCWKDREERILHIQIHNLPRFTLKIYGEDGSLIRTLEHNDQAGYSIFIWDCRNTNGNLLSDGIYGFSFEIPSLNDPIIFWARIE